jgi:hypothetical protein
LQTLSAQVGDHVLPNGRHPIAYVATIPLRYLVTPSMLPRIDAVNAAIRSAFPAVYVLDFDSWMPRDWDPTIMLTWPLLGPDGLHLGCQGHARRADVLDDVAAN